MNILERICEKQSVELLEAIYPNHDELIQLKKQKAGVSNAVISDDFQTLRNNFYFNDREQPPEYLLSKVNTGNVSKKAYGVNIRPVQMTRGNRQGNNAFLEH